MTDRNVLLYGKIEPQLASVKLTAGPLTLVYEAGSLRSVSLGKTEIINRVYVSIRDRVWMDVPCVISDEKIQVSDNSFQISFNAMNQKDEISFHWQALITGSPSGEIRYEMKGIAQSNFWHNRLGFCVLHPARECCGAACRIEHADGIIHLSSFPFAISPHQPFTDIQAVAHQIRPDIWAEVRFEGGTFEMEDQRNWSDNSFKSYSPPLSIPYPVEVNFGTLISQAVTLSLTGKIPGFKERVQRKIDHPVLSIQPQITVPVPQFGLGIASHGLALQAGELERLRRLNLHHLRVDLCLYKPDFGLILRRAWQEAQALDVTLEIALIFSENAAEELAALTRALVEIKPQVSSWLVFDRKERTTPTRLAEIVRRQLSSFFSLVPVGGGAKTYFAELNRNRAIQSTLDAVSYSLNPQVHVTDNLSLMESLPAQAEMVQNARQIIGSKPLLVSPVTLKPRFNSTTGEPTPLMSGELPASVDPRQASLFGASWTLGSLKYLGESGVDSVTYYETSGWQGVMETPDGSPLPDLFCSFPGCVFPLYHVLADFGEFSKGELIKVSSSHPQRVVGFALRKGLRLRVMLANLDSTPCILQLRGLTQPHSIRYLNETNVENAMKFPEEWRAQSDKLLLAKDPSRLELLPYSIATIDCDLTINFTLL